MISTLLVTLFAGGGGLASIWIAGMFVPGVALAIKSALDFLRSPLGLVVAVIAFGLFLFSAGWIGGDIHGASETRAAWHADTAAKKDEADRLIAENKIRAAADADKRIAEVNAYAETLAEKVKKYEQENPARAGMRLTADDIKRMRHGFE